MTGVADWAHDEFGAADLGDVRRTRRLVDVAAEVARKPAGTVTDCIRSSAAREGAFRFVENPRFSADGMREASHQATARRCSEHELVIVPVDGSTLTFTDRMQKKGLTKIGARFSGGLLAMSALATTEGGTTLGLCGQQTWSRPHKSPHTGRKHAIPGVQTEMRYWTEVMASVRATLAAAAPDCRPWFQCDRGADCWQVLRWATDEDALVTVRATHDRRLHEDDRRLWDKLEKEPVLGRIQVRVRGGRIVRKRTRSKGGPQKCRYGLRPARIATLSVRSTRVCVVVRNDHGTPVPTELNAVLVRERRATTSDAIEWMLLTTHPIRSRRQVMRVVRAYAQRWRIEEFHRMWKSGLCNVEDSQLRSQAALEKWATILGAVATRAMRLTQLARSTPDVPALSELTRFELDALVALRKPKGVKLGAEPTLAEAVRWIADLGGYVGPWNGPPGQTIVGRGLEQVVTAATALESIAKMR